MKKEEIKEIIPYDDPFLFVDEVVEIGDDFIKGIYFAKKEADYFKGHFRDFKIMPGVLIVEALAQLSTILLRRKIKNHQDYHFLAYSVRGVRFLKPIFPDEKIELSAYILGIYPLAETSLAEKIANVKGEVFTQGKKKAIARIQIAIVRKEKFKEKYGK